MSGWVTLAIVTSVFALVSSIAVFVLLWRTNRIIDRMISELGERHAERPRA
jgi:ATP/ADP translocase